MQCILHQSEQSLCYYYLILRVREREREFEREREEREWRSILLKSQEVLTESILIMTVTDDSSVGLIFTLYTKSQRRAVCWKKNGLVSMKISFSFFSS